MAEDIIKQFTLKSNRCFAELAASVADDKDFRSAVSKIVKEIHLRSNNSAEPGHEDAQAYFAFRAQLNDVDLREAVRQDLLKFRGEEEVDFTPLPKKKKQSFDTFTSMWSAHNKADEGGEDGGRNESEERKRGAVAMATTMMNVRNKIGL